MCIRARVLAVIGLCMALGACESEPPGPAEKLGKQIDESREEVAKSLEDAAEQTRDKLQEAAKSIEFNFRSPQITPVFSGVSHLALSKLKGEFLRSGREFYFQKDE